MRKFIDTVYLRKQKQSNQLRFYVFPRTNSPLSTMKVILTRIIVLFLIAALSYNFYITFTPFTSAAFNEQINYQGKLTDANNIPVADGSYNMRFQLCTASDCTGGSDPLWTETHCYSPDSGSTCDGTGTDQRISVTSGLFSVLLGSITNLSSVDFNQTLYLEVQVGGTSASSPSWETLTPRKTLGAVPAAFEAGQLDGIDSASFARSDADDTISGLFTITKVPAGTGVDQGSLYINPASATADYTLLGLAVGGSEKFRAGATGNLAVSGNVTVSGGELFLTGIASSSSTTEGTIYYDTDDDQLKVYANGKWQADRTVATKIVAANDSQNKEKADYQADGTGDDEQIEDAIAALPAGGGVVYLLEGTYSIGTPADCSTEEGIDITDDNISLIGAGRGTVLQRACDSPSPDGVITVGNGTATVTGVTIANLSIDGQEATYFGSNNYGILFDENITQSKIQGTWVHDTEKNAIYLAGQSGEENTYNLVSGNDVRSGNVSGIALSYSNYNTVSGNNIITINNYGISIEFSESNTIVDNNIRDTGSGGTVAAAIGISSSPNNIVVGNNIIDSDDHGIEVSYSSRNTVSSNNISGISVAKDGILIDGVCNNNTISSNNIYDSNGARYGINILGSFSNDNYLIGNEISGGGFTADIIDNGTNTTIQHRDQFEIESDLDAGGTMLSLGLHSSTVTLTGALTGTNMDLSTNLTATGFNVTGQSVALPTVTNTGAGTYDYLGLTVSAGGALEQNTAAGTTNWLGADINLPTITSNFAGSTITAYGLNLTIPDSAVTETLGTATAAGINIEDITTGPASGTLYGLNIGSIGTPGAGTETAINIGSGWDTGINISASPAESAITITSNLTADRSTDVMTITQPNNDTYNSTGNLLQLTNSDVDSTSTGAVLAIYQGASGGTGINLQSNVTGAYSIGIDINDILSGGVGIDFDVVNSGTVGIQFNSSIGGTGIDFSGISSTGTPISIYSARATTGTMLELGGSSSMSLTAFEGDMIRIDPSRTHTGATSIDDTGNFLDITRSNTMNNAGGSFTISGDLATFSSNCTETLGTCTDTSNILELNQQYANASGAVLNILNSGAGSAVSITDTLTSNKTSDVVSITRPSDETYNSTGNLLQLTNQDTGSTAALLSLSQAATNGTVMEITNQITSSNIGIQFANSTIAGTAIHLGGANISGTGILMPAPQAGTGIYINSSQITSGASIDLSGSLSGDIATFTGDILKIKPIKSFDLSLFNITDTGNYLDIARDNSIAVTGNTYTISGDLVTFSSKCTPNGGTCTDTANILELNQQYASASGAVLNILSSSTTSPGIALTANSLTTGDAVTLSATGLTTGSMLVATGPTSTGVTDHFVKLTSDIGSAASLIYGAPDFNSGLAGTSYGVNITSTNNSSAGADTDYNYYSSLSFGPNSGTATGYYSTVSSTSTSANTLLGFDSATTVTGAISSGIRAIYGARFQPASTAASTGGTLNLYGSYINASSINAAISGTPTTNVYGSYITTTGTYGSNLGTVNQYGIYVANGTSNTFGTSTKYGIYVESPTGADTNYAAVFAGGNVGIGTTGPDRRLDVLDSDSSPQLRISQADGTVYAEFEVEADGNLTLNLDPGENIYFAGTGSSTGANLWICNGSACAIDGFSLDGDGSLFVEQYAYFGGNANYIKIGLGGVLTPVGTASIAVPSGDPTVDSAGEIAIDTTDDQLIYYGGAKRVLTYKKAKSVTIESPADADNFLLWRTPDPITITDIECIVDPADAAESVVIDIQERDSTGDNPATVDATITCDNDGASDDGSLSNGAIDANDWISIDIGTVTGTVTQVSVTITYTIDAE